ncbi:RNA-directed DNA polymerase, eukaryota, reverse transcriptase zinc-binding domain protein [Tanacetum coccineum]
MERMEKGVGGLNLGVGLKEERERERVLVVTKGVLHYYDAANGGKERKLLWKDLQIYRRTVRNEPWVMMGDMNVTLNPNEHSTHPKEQII